MLSSKAVTIITLPAIQKLGNVRIAPDLLYILMYIKNKQKENPRKLFVVIFGLSACSCDC